MGFTLDRRTAIFLGYDNLAGYLHNGMLDWQNVGLPLQRIGEMTVRELNWHKTPSPAVNKKISLTPLTL